MFNGSKHHWSYLWGHWHNIKCNQVHCSQSDISCHSPSSFCLSSISSFKTPSSFLVWLWRSYWCCCSQCLPFTKLLLTLLNFCREARQFFQPHVCWVLHKLFFWLFHFCHQYMCFLTLFHLVPFPWTFTLWTTVTSETASLLFSVHIRFLWKLFHHTHSSLWFLPLTYPHHHFFFPSFLLKNKHLIP